MPMLRVTTRTSRSQTILASMARTFAVNSFASWCDEYAEQTGKRHSDAAGGGEDWMDTTPVLAGKKEAIFKAAAKDLHDRIDAAWRQATNVRPDGAVYSPKSIPQILWSNAISPGSDAEKLWAHYAVMSAIGSGVAWEDDHQPLWLPPALTLRVGDLHLYMEAPMWPEVIPEKGKRAQKPNKNRGVPKAINPGLAAYAAFVQPEFRPVEVYSTPALSDTIR